jgi:TRAP-type mannitol/chloroaromatic compound transport system permease small subunit
LGKRANQVLFMGATLGAIAITSFALYHSSIMVFESWQLEMSADTISETPIYLSQMVIPAGLAMFDLQLFANFIKRFL